MRRLQGQQQKRLRVTRMKKNNLLVSGVAIALLASNVAYAEDKPVSGGALRWGVTTEPSCFDPHYSSQQAAFFVARNYIDSLIAKKPDGSFAPWLATQWTISPDGTEYTFTLRAGVTFHDGERLDAEAV